VTLDASHQEDDRIEETQGIKVVYEADFAKVLSGSEIDYSSNWLKRGFFVKGPCQSNC
jgi:Fe-S cluster assembly iron-binding protein IscA